MKKTIIMLLIIAAQIFSQGKGSSFLNLYSGSGTTPGGGEPARINLLASEPFTNATYWQTVSATVNGDWSYSTAGIGGMISTAGQYQMAIGTAYDIEITASSGSFELYAVEPSFASPRTLIGAVSGAHTFTFTPSSTQEQGFYLRNAGASSVILTKFNLYTH